MNAPPGPAPLSDQPARLTEPGEPQPWPGERRDPVAYKQLLDRLRALSQAMASAPDLPTVYRGLREFIVASAPCNGLYVSLSEPATGERRCVFAFAEGREEDVSQLPPMPLTHSPSSRALRSGQIVLTEDFQAAIRGQPRVDLGMDVDPRVPQSAISVPMQVLGRTIGVFEIQSVERRVYTEEHVTAMRMAASLAAIAIENVRLLERERAERLQAETAKENYRLLFRGNPLPMWVFDAESLRFLAVNEAAVRHYGFSEAEFLAMTLRDIRPPEGIPELLRALQETAENRTTSCRHRKKSGELIDVEITGDAIAFAGRAARLVVVQDVTDRRRLEAQFLRAQRMESIGTLAGGIAHDLNNLLAPIAMSVDLLKLEAPDAESRHLIEVIERSAKRSASLVKQVLSFARGVEGARVAVKLRAVLHEVAAIVENTFPKNIAFSVTAPPDMPGVTGDPTQIQQVLLNLCVNARDAMPQGGRLRLTARSVVVRERTEAARGGAMPGRYVAIEVQDSGTGMPPELIDKIFEPFFTTKPVGKGSGLGLATALGIVRSHKGFIEVDSEIGSGSTFRVLLPARTDDGAAPVERAPPALPRGRGELVLVVDDETAILTVTRHTLETFGYRALTVENGAEAVRALAERDEEIALVILDMMMPVMDGAEAAVAMRRLQPKLRIVGASGLDVAVNTRASAAGITRLLRKPFSTGELLTTVRAALDEL